MPDGPEQRSRRFLLAPNAFGLGAALGGLVAGFVCQAIAVSAFDQLSGHPRHPSTYGQAIVSLLGLWLGMLAAVVLALPGRASLRARLASLPAAYGLRVRWPDVPLGVAIGVASQLALVPVVDLVLIPFVPDLAHRLGAPARSLTAHVSGGGLVILGLLVCVGSPLVEELFFRGLLLRGLYGRLQALTARGALGWAIVFVGIFFGLVHFEALQLLALIAFGCVLGVLASASGRLGPGIFAHIAFNATTFVALAWAH